MLLTAAVAGCAGATEPLRAGALYSVDSGEGYFQVAKVLVVDSTGVHVRLYKNRFKTRPDKVDFEKLSLGSIDNPDGFGMGHLPLTHEAFRAWEPVFIVESPITADELEGYRQWQAAKGGYFGDPQHDD